MAPKDEASVTPATSELAAPDENTSSQSHFSTYAEVTLPDENPPVGRLVEQTRGRPDDAVPKRFGDK